MHSNIPKHRILTIPITAVDLFFMLTILAMNLSLIRSIIKHYKTKKVTITVIFSILTIFAFLLFVICRFILDCIEAYIIFAYSESSFFHIIDTIGKILIVIYGICQALMIFLFTIRIDKTFKGTEFELNANIVKLLYVAACISNGILIVYSTNLLPSEINQIIPFCWVASHIIFSIILIVLFIKKIDSVVLIQVKTQISEKQTDSSETISKAVKDAKLLNVAIKHGILVPMAIISTFVCAIVADCIQIIFGEQSCWFIAGSLLTLDSVFSSLCIFLLFHFNNNIYSKLCIRLHRLCKQCKVRQLENSKELKIIIHTSKSVHVTHNPNKIDQPTNGIDNTNSTKV